MFFKLAELTVVLGRSIERIKHRLKSIASMDLKLHHTAEFNCRDNAEVSRPCTACQ